MKKIILFLFLFFLLENIFSFNAFANSKDLTDGGGTAQGSFSFDEKIPGNAFDNNLTSYWLSAPNDGSSIKDRSWIGFTFTEKKVVTGLSILQSKYAADGVTSVMVQGSDDRSIWYDVELISLELKDSVQYITLSNIKSYKSWRLLAKNGKYDWIVHEIELFGPDLIPPAMPNGLNVVAGPEKAILNWNSNSEEDINGYNIYLDGNKINSSPVQGNYYEITNLSSGREYKVSISAVDTSGNESPRTPEVSVVPLPPPDKVPPGDVTSISVLPSYTEAEVTFTKPSDPDVDHYEVYLNGNLLENIKTESYKITGLAEDTEYTVKIVSVDTSGNKSNGNSVSFRTKKFVPQPPQNVGSSPGEDENGKYLMITWNEVPKAKSYKIYIDGKFIAEVPAGTTQYKAYGYDPNRDHRVEVTTIYDSGEESDPAKAPDKWDQTRDKMELNVRDLLVMTFQFLMIFWNVILLILASILGPKIYRFLKSIAKEKGVKF